MSLHAEAYKELDATYRLIQNYLDSTMLTPDQESLILQCEAYGEQIYRYNRALIEKQSALLDSREEDVQSLLMLAKAARKSLEEVTEHAETVAKIARGLDKLLKQLAKFV
ncbi:hypothetical protein [Photobacterium sp. R1]